jgi:type II secretory pathway component GspD/PulD (secretin)
MFTIRRTIAITSVIGLLILPEIVAADPTILEVIQLKHRTTDEIIPLIHPFLDGQGVLSGMRGRLIIRTTPDNLQEIKRILNEIDSAPRRLIITIKQNVDRVTAQHLLKFSGNASNKGSRKRIPGNTGNRGLIIADGYGDDNIKVQALNHQELKSDRNTQQLQVLDGSRAFIYIGKSLPIPLRNIVHTPQGARVIESVQFHDATTGFTVVPRVNGRHVTLEVSPQQNTPNRQLPGGINTQHIVTSVSGRLGEWIDLGGSERNKSRQASTPNSPHSDMIINEQRTVLIKVEEAH